jgi:hypothetical protein
MSFRYRRTKSFGKLLRVNLTKTGVGVSFGRPGLRYSVHSSGRTTKTVGLPGTGLYYRKDAGGGRSARTRATRTRTTGIPTNASQRKVNNQIASIGCLIGLIGLMFALVVGAFAAAILNALIGAPGAYIGLGLVLVLYVKWWAKHVMAPQPPVASQKAQSATVMRELSLGDTAETISGSDAVRMLRPLSLGTHYLWADLMLDDRECRDSRTVVVVNVVTSGFTTVSELRLGKFETDYNAVGFWSDATGGTPVMVVLLGPPAHMTADDEIVLQAGFGWQ